VPNPGPGLVELAEFNDSYSRIFIGLANKGLVPATHAFANNVHRAYSLFSFPALLMDLAPRVLDVWREQRDKLLPGIVAYPQTVTAEEFKRALAEPTLTLVMGTPKEILQRWKNGAALLDGLVEFAGDTFALPTESMLASMITGMWTAFEVLAGDLWEAALNCHARVLSDLKGPKKRKQEKKRSDDDEPPKRRPGDDEATIPIKLIQKHGYDLSSKMGSLLRNKFNFGLLESIRSAYLRAFSEHSENIEKAIFDPSLDQLAMLRNVLVHRGGIADEDFCKTVKRFKFPHFIGIPEQTAISLTGQIVLDVIDPAIKTSVQLAQTVDSWLTKH